MNDFLKNNLFAVAAVVLTVLGFLTTVYIKAEVASQLAEKGIPSSERISNMEEDIDENSDDIADVQDRWNRLVDALAAENN